MPARWRTQATRVQSVAIEVCWRPVDGEAAGDFYDVLDLRDGRVVLIIGDAPGSGPEAAELGEALRFQLRRAFRRTEHVSDALRMVDRSLVGVGDDVIATAVCGVLYPAEGRLEVANAGHLPILLSVGSQARFLEAESDPPLGTDTDRRVVPYELEADAALFLFTDGLIERREASLEHGLSTLLRAGQGLTGASAWASELARRATDLLGQPTDDATVMSVRLTNARAGRTPASAPAGRVVLRLYVDPDDPRSVRTEAVVRQLADRLEGTAAVELEVMELTSSSREAEADGVLAAPTLIRLLPTPPLRVIGGLRSADELARALQLPFPQEDNP